MEMLYNVAGWRAPFVLVNVSRGLAAPLTLEPDHNDILAARDSGCLQIHCATCQEVLDTTLLAFRLAEDARVRLPVIVNMDGFYLSFTREPVAIPEAEAVDAFLPPFDPGNMAFRASMPTSQAVVVLGGSPYSYFRYEMHLAALKALDVYDEIAEEFGARFGRTHGAIEAYRCEDAEIVLVMMGSFATKAKAAVDALRAAGYAIGLVRPRLLRPFPTTHLQRVLAGKRGVAVIDQNLSLGKGGVLHAEVASVLYGRPDAPAILASFIGGLGGRDITDEEFFEIARITREAAASRQTPLPRLLYNRDELLQIQKLQSIAHVEREELRKNP
jgi:pyruvate ferredoxin oxidoreductase alpha subunit